MEADIRYYDSFVCRLSLAADLLYGKYVLYVFILILSACKQQRLRFPLAVGSEEVPLDWYKTNMSHRKFESDTVMSVSTSLEIEQGSRSKPMAFRVNPYDSLNAVWLYTGIGYQAYR